MKLVMNERLKHRLIGLAVIMSIAAIFTPAIMKKSSQRLDRTMTMNVKLPAKPVQPDVAMTDEQTLFKAASIARVELPNVTEESQLPQLAKADTINKTSTVPPIPQQQFAALKSSKPGANKPLALVKPEVRLAQRSPLKAKVLTKTPEIRQGGYTVQLASFSKLLNARLLATQLQNKGFKARINKVKAKQGDIYKVFVGQEKLKNQAEKLKNQLASAVQINGFIVNTGVS